MSLIPAEGNRKYYVVMIVTSMGFILSSAAFVLAFKCQLANEYVRVVEIFAGMASIATGAFMAGNAVEHFSKRGDSTTPGAP